MSERSRHGGVDEIPLPFAAGRVWLCGKHFVGPDAEVALAQTGANAIVCLNEARELEPRYPDYVAWLRANAPRRAIWLPIPDLDVPPVAVLLPFLSDLHQRVMVGDGLLIHCGAGIGRAGTIAAALLMEFEVPMADALAIIASSRPSAGPQTLEQEQLLAALTNSEKHPLD